MSCVDIAVVNKGLIVQSGRQDRELKVGLQVERKEL